MRYTSANDHARFFEMSALGALHTRVLVTAFVLLAPPIAAAGEGDAAIAQLTAVVREGRLLADLSATNTLNLNLLKRLESGLPVTVEYEVQLRGQRLDKNSRWSQTASLTLEAVYDAVAREYAISRRVDGELVSVDSARDLETLDPLLSGFEKMPVFSVEDLDLAQPATVKARVIERRRLWLWIIPTVSASDWVEAAVATNEGNEQEP